MKDEERHLLLIEAKESFLYIYVVGIKTASSYYYVYKKIIIDIDLKGAVFE